MPDMKLLTDGAKAGKQFIKNPKMRAALERIKPRAIEAGVGAIPGAAIGGATGAKEDENGKKHILRNALIGAGVGGAAGVGINAAAHGVRKVQTKGLNNAANEVHGDFKKFHDDILNGEVQRKGEGAADEQFYARMYDARVKKRENIKKDLEEFKANKAKAEKQIQEEFDKYPYLYNTDTHQEETYGGQTYRYSRDPKTIKENEQRREKFKAQHRKYNPEYYSFRKHHEDADLQRRMSEPFEFNFFGPKTKFRDEADVRRHFTDDMAESEAKKMSREKYRKKFVEPGPKKLNIDEEKKHAFGSLRKSLKGNKDLKDFKNGIKNDRDTLSDHHGSTWAHDLANSMFGKPNDGAPIHEFKGVETDVDEVKNSQAFKKKMKDLEGKARKDSKTGNKFESFDGGVGGTKGGAKGSQNITDEDMKKYSDLLGVDLSKVKNKSDIDRAYKKQALKYHPDRNPGNKEFEDKFKDINAAKDHLHNTEFFNKLAFEVAKDYIYKQASKQDWWQDGGFYDNHIDWDAVHGNKAHDEKYLDSPEYQKAERDAMDDVDRFMRKHPKYKQSVEDQKFNDERNKAHHKHSAKVGNAIALGVPTLAGLAYGATGKTPLRKVGKGAKAFGLAFVPSVVAGGLKGMSMDEKARNKKYGPVRYDTMDKMEDDFRDYQKKKYSK